MKSRWVESFREARIRKEHRTRVQQRLAAVEYAYEHGLSAAGLRLRAISDMAAGQDYLPEIRADHNRRFARLPQNSFNAHRPMRECEDLDEIFTNRFGVSMLRAFVLPWAGTTIRILYVSPLAHVPPKVRICAA